MGRLDGVSGDSMDDGRLVRFSRATLYFDPFALELFFDSELVLALALALLLGRLSPANIIALPANIVNEVFRLAQCIADVDC